MMSEKIPDNVQKRIDGMAEAFREQLMGLYVWSNEEQAGAGPTAMQIEAKIREWIRRHVECPLIAGQVVVPERVHDPGVAFL